jgi:hypothetical protein
MRSAFDFEVRALSIVLNVEVAWLLGMDKTRKSMGTKRDAI